MLLCSRVSQCYILRTVGLSRAGFSHMEAFLFDMRPALTFRSISSLCAVGALIGLAACSGGGAGNNGAVLPSTQSAARAPTSTESTLKSQSLSRTDYAAAASAGSSFKYHVMPLRTKTTGSTGSPAARHPNSIVYPDDLVYSGGALVKKASIYNIMVDCAASCWGSPGSFLRNLSESSFIHVTDPYVGLTANNRYPWVGNIPLGFNFFTNTLYQNDLLAILHAAAARYGTGYGKIYNIFLPQGVDTCIDQSTQCYSPDNPPNWVFCAYHGSVQYSDIGHVLMTVQPYQNVPGCQITGTPNGSLIDSTDSTLSHETFETITDPDPPTGWYNFRTYNGEIADECAYLIADINLHGHTYGIQREYSNKYHGCTDAP